MYSPFSRSLLRFSLWLLPFPCFGVHVHVVAPKDPRKDGGLKFQYTYEASSLEDLEEAFIQAHSKEYHIPYASPLLFSFKGEALKSLDRLKDETNVPVKLRLHRPRGLKDDVLDQFSTLTVSTSSTDNATETSAPVEIDACRAGKVMDEEGACVPSPVRKDSPPKLDNNKWNICGIDDDFSSAWRRKNFIEMCGVDEEEMTNMAPREEEQNLASLGEDDMNTMFMSKKGTSAPTEMGTSAREAKIGNTSNNTEEDESSSTGGDSEHGANRRYKPDRDPSIAFNELALGGLVTQRAAEELILAGFRHPFLATRVLHVLGTEKHPDARLALLRLLIQVPLEGEDVKQALRQAECESTEWEMIVMLHFPVSPQSEGVRRVAECNPSLRLKLVAHHFEQQMKQRTAFERLVEPVNAFIGQTHAQSIVQPMLVEQQFGRRISEAPLSFLFLGPSGVGKTEYARRIASIIHGAPVEELNDGRFVEFKMGNYATEEQFSQWIGVPDGVKGSEGHLTAALKKHPNAVIYLDEIEKAKASAGDRLLGFLDAHGTLQVAKSGEHVKTNGATWILSSNLGTEEVIEAWSKHPHDHDKAYEEVTKAIEAPLKRSDMFRRPELRNRLAAIVPFTPFTNSEVLQVVNLQLQKLQRKYSASSGWKYAEINWTHDVVDYFVNANKEETVKRGNLRSLIKMVENEMNSALAAQLDCRDPKCDALAPAGHLCRFVAPRAHFLMEVNGDQIIARHLPKTEQEAQEECDLQLDPEKQDEHTGAQTLNQRSSPKGSRKSSSQTGADSHAKAHMEGGRNVDRDWWAIWNVEKFLEVYWETLRWPTFSTAFFVAFFSYGFLWSMGILAFLFFVEFAVGWAVKVWSWLPPPIRQGITLAAKAVGGFAVKNVEVTSAMMIFFFIWLCNRLCRCPRRGKMYEYDAEQRDRRMLKLVLEAMEQRDKRLISHIFEAIDARWGKKERCKNQKPLLPPEHPALTTTVGADDEPQRHSENDETSSSTTSSSTASSSSSSKQQKNQSVARTSQCTPSDAMTLESESMCISQGEARHDKALAPGKRMEKNIFYDDAQKYANNLLRSVVQMPDSPVLQSITLEFAPSSNSQRETRIGTVNDAEPPSPKKKIIRRVVRKTKSASSMRLPSTNDVVIENDIHTAMTPSPQRAISVDASSFYSPLPTPCKKGVLKEREKTHNVYINDDFVSEQQERYRHIILNEGGGKVGKVGIIQNDDDDEDGLAFLTPSSTSRHTHTPLSTRTSTSTSSKIIKKNDQCISSLEGEGRPKVHHTGDS